MDAKFREGIDRGSFRWDWSLLPKKALRILIEFHWERFKTKTFATSKFSFEISVVKNWRMIIHHGGCEGKLRVHGVFYNRNGRKVSRRDQLSINSDEVVLGNINPIDLGSEFLDYKSKDRSSGFQIPNSMEFQIPNNLTMEPSPNLQIPNLSHPYSPVPLIYLNLKASIILWKMSLFS